MVFGLSVKNLLANSTTSQRFVALLVSVMLTAFRYCASALEISLTSESFFIHQLDQLMGLPLVDP